MISLEFLLPPSRQRVLSLLLLHPDARYHVREIARLTHTAAGSLHRELSKLAKAQVLLRETSGNQVYYQANIHFPLFNELASILRKTSGIEDVLANALAPLSKKIEIAFIFGSIAQGTENMDSDVDILIIGTIGFADAVTALYPAQNTIGREINPKIYQKAEWQKLFKSKTSFLKEILRKQKRFIIGTNNDLEELSRNKS
jgi:predicted nucleotidyltransferase